MSDDIEVLPTPESSSISGVAYKLSTHTLYIRFISGNKIYEWFDVPQHVFDGFKDTVKNGDSVGKYYHKNVRGQYSNIPSELLNSGCGV